MKWWLLIVSCLVSVSTVCRGQVYGSDYEYHREFIYGINKGTNGGLISGVYVKWGYVKSKDRLVHYGIELANIKHPKETRVQGATGSKNFLLGKSNYLYVVRGVYGVEKVLYKKASQQGVQVSVLLEGGPSFGVQTPYYVDVLEINKSGTRTFSSGETKSVPYTYDLIKTNQKEKIIGVANPFLGLSEASIVPGIHLKSSLLFEFGVFKRHVTGFEAGFKMDAYTSVIEIMPNLENQSVYPQAFLSLLYGFRN